MSSIEVARLTKSVASANKQRIADLLNRIDLLDYTTDDVTADMSSRGKPLTGKWEQSLVAVSNGEIVAVLIAHIKYADPPWYPVDSCYLSEIVVDEACERQGLARRLTEQWLAETADLAPHSLQTNSRTENAPVIDFYKRLGFVEVNRKQYDNRIDLMMFRY